MNPLRFYSLETESTVPFFDTDKIIYSFKEFLLMN